MNQFAGGEYSLAIVVDVREMNLPDDVYEYLDDFYEANEGSYHPYYTSETMPMGNLGNRTKIKHYVNQRLVEMGVPVPPAHQDVPPNLFCVLLRF